MRTRPAPVPPRLLAPGALLLAAFSWGVIWYPYRLLEQAGLSGSLATLASYLLALALLLPIQGRQWRPPPGSAGLLAAMALVAGLTNLAYVLAVIHGEIMRVMLLFYLAPLWTVLFARLLLGERPGRFGYLVIALALVGAVIMLHGDDHPPLPRQPAEWLGLAAGMGFALSNVLTRRLGAVALGTRSLWVFAGVVLVAVAPALLPADAGRALAGLGGQSWLWLLITALGLLLATVAVQYGLAHSPANRAVVILLTELVWAALASWWLAAEVMGAREWLGGALIVAASLLSGRMEEKHV